jgi:L-amino acid N-acyltransferase YncA
MSVPVTVRSMQHSDWPAVQRIYQEGIDTGHATFESIAPSWESFDGSRLQGHRLVAETAQDGIVGWAAVSPVSSRLAYAGVVEHSVYVAAEVRGLGVGKVLLQALIDSTERAGIWTIQSSVFPENRASLRIHEAAGFRIIGHRSRIARMAHGPAADQWRDTILLERRSALVQ